MCRVGMVYPPVPTQISFTTVVPQRLQVTFSSEALYFCGFTGNSPQRQRRANRRWFAYLL